MIFLFARCEPEYFGFPDCQACSCPSTAKCDEVTGECICAPFVTGTAVALNWQKLRILSYLDCQDAPCTMCEENTYGYNAVTGCQECSCRTEGTNGDMSCRFDNIKKQLQKFHCCPKAAYLPPQFGLWAVQLCRQSGRSSVRPLCVGRLELSHL